jgi:hypothetical protein
VVGLVKYWNWLGIVPGAHFLLMEHVPPAKRFALHPSWPDVVQNILTFTETGWLLGPERHGLVTLSHPASQPHASLAAVW